jgi:hypothetical protein
MWVDYDVPNWFLTSKNFYGRHFQNGHHNTAPFWKWRPVEIFQCRESIRDIIIYPHIKFWWYRTMLNFYRPYFMPCFAEFHETWWSYRYMFLVGPKVFSFVVKAVKIIFWGVQRGWRLL